MSRTPTLSAGDKVEHSLTVEININGQKIWSKFGATTEVRAGETASTTANRLANFVEKRVQQQIIEIRENNK